MGLRCDDVSIYLSDPVSLHRLRGEDLCKDAALCLSGAALTNED